MAKRSTITIHEGFTDSNTYYTSYHEGVKLLKQGVDFTTHCTNFLNVRLNEYEFDNVYVKDKYFKTVLDLNELYDNISGKYTDREIRCGHNIERMYIANGLSHHTLTS